MTMDEQICFVVMGFGKKTDYETGRTLDLDATYEAIIVPAAEKNNLRCIRANDVLHSGVIDVKMFEMLLRSDLVIADISTGNVNAVYELGVRHAMRPHSTIIMKEKEGRLYFDLNHVNTFEYVHLGEDIGHREAQRAQVELSRLIASSLKSEVPDSPVYTFLPKLKEPQLSDNEFRALLDRADELGEKFSTIMADAEAAANRSDHVQAIERLQAALDMNPSDPYLFQQLALHTYKSEQPSKWLALVNAAQIIENLHPEKSNDPETLGIGGAIYKNMWLSNNDTETLNKAIHFYRRGFELRGDYYNGENAATCLEHRSLSQQNENESFFDIMSARKIRESIVEDLSSIIGSDEFAERSDRKWVFATLANCSFALDDKRNARDYERKFYVENPVEWESETYQAGKDSIESFLRNASHKST